MLDALDDRLELILCEASRRVVLGLFLDGGSGGCGGHGALLALTHLICERKTWRKPRQFRKAGLRRRRQSSTVASRHPHLSVLVLGLVERRLLIGARFALIFGAPLVIRHAVDGLA